MKILVASTGRVKLAGVRLAFGEREDVIVDGKRSTSGVNEQPVGWAEMALGVSNQMESVMIVGGYDYYAAIENGIVRMGNRWFDFGWVQVADHLGRIGIAQTAGVEFPAEFVEEARLRGFHATTVGSVIAENFECRADDPHFFLTGGMASRRDLISQAVRIALGQLCMQDRING